jgi:sugar lactone lactonase YvrE
MGIEPFPAPEVVIPADAEVGEGPVLDRRTGRLAWVDITGGWLHQSDLATGETTSEHFDTMVGAALPRESEPGFMLAVAEGLGLWTPDGGFELVDPCLPEPHVRFNDAKCDSRGRAWGGTNHLEFVAGEGKVRVWDGTGVSKVQAEGLTLPNGLGWSPDDRTMYLADTFENVLLRADFDADAGAVGQFTPLCRVEGGYPDGLAVDADGNIWLAVWAGWEVRRFSPTGELTGAVRTPVAQPSSCAISDEGVLYVTSATSGLDAVARAVQPQAGSVFALSIGVAGVPVSAFKG